MPDRFVYSHIRRLPIFQNVTDEQLVPIADAFQVMRFEPGEVLFQQGQPSHGMYMFISGKGALIQTTTTGLEQQVGVVSENQFLNEAGLFRPLVETATLRIVESAVVLLLTRQRLMSALAQYPEIKQAMGLPTQPARIPQTNVAPPTANAEYADAPIFPGQRDNEKVLLFTRRHWWSFGRLAWLPILGMGLMLFVALRLGEPLLTVGCSGLALIFPGLIALYLYLEWQNDAVIVTDQRVVRIERNIMKFTTNVSEFPLGSIQEANAEIPVSDPFARLFNYGTVALRTAGGANNLNLDFVPNPEHLQELIFSDRQRQQEQLADQQRNKIRAEIDKMMGQQKTQVIGQQPSPQQSSTVSNQPSNPAAHQMRYTNADGATVYRKHFIVWLQNILVPGIVLLAGVIVLIIKLVNPAFLDAAGFILAFALLIVGGLWAYWSDWDWRNDLYIVGDENITIIHKRPLWLQSEKDQILLSRVDNVVSDVRGVLQNLFNFGYVRISLIGADATGTKVFENVPDPRSVQEEISRRQARAKQSAQEGDERRQRETMSEYLSVYHETLQQRGVIPGNPSAQSVPQPNTGEPGQVKDGSRPPNIPRVRRD